MYILWNPKFLEGTQAQVYHQCIQITIIMQMLYIPRKNMDLFLMPK